MTFSADQGVQAASHQRQLSLKYSEIQQRLIDNQSLLNTLEKAGDPSSLESLLSELKRRVEQDKEALRQWTALRKSTFGGNTKNPPLAARLLQFSRGCELALQLMNQDNLRVSFPRTLAFSNTEIYHIAFVYMQRLQKLSNCSVYFENHFLMKLRRRQILTRSLNSYGQFII